MIQQLTKEQAIVLTGFTGILCTSFSYFHEDVEKRLGRPVWSHEFADEEVVAQVKKAYKEDFKAMIYKGEE